MILAGPQTISGQENLGHQDQSKELLVNRDEFPVSRLFLTFILYS